MDKGKWRQFQALAYFFLQYRWMYFGFALLSLANGLLEAANLVLLWPFLQGLLRLATDSQFPAVGWIDVGAFLSRWWPGIDSWVLTCAILIILNVLRPIVATGTDWMIATTTARVAYAMRRRIYQTYSDAPYAFFLKHKVGELVYNSTIPSKSLAIALQTVPKWIVEGCRFIGVGVILIWLQPTITFLILLLSLLLYFPLTKWVGRRVYQVGVQTRNLSTELFAQMTEFYTGVKPLIVANAKSAWLKRLDTLNEGVRQAFIHERTLPILPGRAVELLTICGMLGAILVLRFLSPQRFHQHLSLIGVYGIAWLRLLPSMVQLGQLTFQFFTFLPDVERLYSVLSQEPPVAPQGRYPIRRFQRSIVFDHVSFAYPNRPALFTELCLEFSPGKFFAIAGLSGAGKTTLINLILGMFHPTSGRILIDGVDLKDIDRSSWYERIGLVSQDVTLFHTSVLENIRLFKTQYGDAEVERVAQLAYAHEFILQLPQGYQTIVGERGMRLSGGQQQRIALARALLHNPDILLLDEATSALDSESERLVQQAIQTACQNRTVIAITHRLSAIAQADRIYVIENGRLSGDGRHEELLMANAHYQTLQP